MTRHLLSILLLFTTLLPTAYGQEEQVLVTVEGFPITLHHVDQLIASSPLADRYPTLGQEEQSEIRGNILIRLINLQLLYLEAVAQKLDQNAAFIAEREAFRKGFLYKRYMDRLRDQIKISDEAMKELVAQLKGNSEALDAAVAQYKTQQYQQLRNLALRQIRQQLHLTVHSERITQNLTPKTILAEADNYQLLFSDLDIPLNNNELIDTATIEEQLYQQLEIDLVNRMVRVEPGSLDTLMEAFNRERLPALLLEQKRQAWIPTEADARHWFKQHRTLGEIPEQRKIAQIVLDDHNKAEALKKRLASGESFYQMARLHTIDPYGKQQAGQMGWLPKGTAMGPIEQALAQMKPEEVSAVIKTEMGLHLILLEAVRPAQQLAYEAIQDRVQQAMLEEQLPPFLHSLQKKYTITFTEPVAERSSQNH